MVVAFSKPVAPMKVGIASMVALGGVVVLYWILKPKESSKFKKAFAEDSRRPMEPMEHDRKKRNIRMKRLFDCDQVPTPLDAIVIGSGVGGLTTAAILAKTGRKVLVLEQHGKAGGCTHTFVKDEAEWDVGIHYVGKMGKNQSNRLIMDQLTDGQLDWAEMAEDYDNAVVSYGDGEKNKVRMIPVYKDLEKWQQDLIQRYPKHEQGIKEYFRMLKEACDVSDYLAVLKLVPIWLCKLMTALPWVFPGIRKFYHYYHELILQDVLEKLFPGDPEIQTVLSYNWGDAGSEPSKVGFGMVAAIQDHFATGSFYPVGGSSEIAYTMIPVIEKAGGAVMMKTKVTDILMSDDMKTAIGVRVLFNKKQRFEIHAPLIISDAGAINTFERMLPEKAALMAPLGRIVKENKVYPSCVMFQVFIGLTGGQEDLELPNKNFWITYDQTPEDLKKWSELSLDDALQQQVPMLFVGFPSAKDPSYGERLPDRSVCVAISIIPTHWFKQWSDRPKGKRGEEYESLKMAMAEKIWDQLVDIFPQISDRRRYMDAGTPVTAEHYQNAIVGEAYGLSHDQSRFDPEVFPYIRPESGINNLWLTGK